MSRFRFNPLLVNLDMTGIDKIEDDPSPTLGGNLDTNGFCIEAPVNQDLCLKSSGTGDITLEPQGTGSVIAFREILIDNLKLDGNTLSSTDTNGDLILAPDETGKLVVSSLTGIMASNGASGISPRSLTQPSAGITIANNDGAAGNPTFALANDLAALEALGSTGIAVRSAADTWVQRSIAVTASTGLSIADGNGVAGNPTLAGVQATTSALGVVELGTAAEVTTGTSTTLVPSIASLIGHEGIVKAWAKFAMDGTFSDAFNVSSVTDTGTGQATINFTTNFATGNYAAHVTPQDGANGITAMIDTQTVSTCLVEFRDASATLTLNNLIDPSGGGHFIAIGDR